ncbi:CdaR family protein [Parapedobacter tibetensis]|uniref:CdaR family protein n=1 Tax=Parapedobacter tibetensis TaxID=2972951 RepID=UPI00214D8A10|nr:CdaR family protein [Parapedobacter tibetensis]
MPALNLNKTQRRKLSIFIKCIIFSFLAWALFAVSNTYIYTVKSRLQYVNVPENRAFHPLQSDTVNLRLEASGWQLLFSTLQSTSQTIQVDLSGLENRNWIVFTNQLGFINRQFPTNTNRRVVSVSPDTLYFDFSKQTERKVPVIPVYNIQFDKQYNIIDEPTISPEYVTITGPLEDVVQIEHWETDTMKISNANGDIRAVVHLKQNQRSNINVYPTSVEINIPVGEVTEKILEVPLKAENANQFSSVKLLPGKVRLTVMVSLRDFGKVTNGAFEAVVNMDDWIDHDIKNLPVIITRVPDFCKLVKVEPQNVDFFVRK